MLVAVDHHGLHQRPVTVVGRKGNGTFFLGLGWIERSKSACRDNQANKSQSPHVPAPVGVASIVCSSVTVSQENSHAQAMLVHHRVLMCRAGQLAEHVPRPNES